MDGIGCISGAYVAQRNHRGDQALSLSPIVLAKMAQQIEHISGGRFAINLSNAWNRPELERAGIGFAEHDERYAYGRERIAVVDALLRGETVNRHGDNFRIDQ